MADIDIDEAFDDISTFIWEIEYGIRHFGRVVDPDIKSRKFNSLCENLEKVKSKEKLLQYNLKMLDLGPTRERYERKYEEIDEKVAKFAPLIHSLDPNGKSNLLGSTKHPGHVALDMPDIPEVRASPFLAAETTHELTKKTRNLQDDAFDRLDKTNQTLDGTIYVGVDTTHRLRTQGEQLNALTPRLEQTSTNVKAANKKTRKLLRLISCDRVSTALFLVVVLLVGAIVILLVLQSQNKIKLPIHF